MTSLWLADRANRPIPPRPLLETARDADVVVVGAGITGLVTAVLLARAGKGVIVLEALSAGAGATGNTTAKVSLLQGTKLSKIIAKHGRKRARQYVEGNREGQDSMPTFRFPSTVASDSPTRLSSIPCRCWTA